jgi:TrmH family RNA methyltransferase
MISKNQLKKIRALGQKKNRKLQQEFLVQGEKNVLELLDSNLNLVELFATEEFIAKHQARLPSNTISASEQELTKVSTLSSNNAAIAIVKMPPQNIDDFSGTTIVLDGVSDPGNLGTIIRLADWYGIKNIICSPDCADVYNPKTISSTMGSFTRINVIYQDLTSVLENNNKAVYGAYLGGESVHECQFETDCFLVMGSESHGIREEASAYISHKITIPAFGQAESLNVAMATGIILDNMKRQ